jgi:hypothetical protein
MILLHEKIRTLRKINQTFAKRRRIKKTHVRAEDALIVENARNLIEQKEILRQRLSERSMKRDVAQIESSDVRRYEKCDKTNHNARICQKIKKSFEKDNDIENN